MSRPSDYTEELALAICERIADGESLRSICLDDAMPAKSSVFKWLREHEAFSDHYARARETQADSLADEITHIADTPLVGITRKTDEEGNTEITEGDMIQHRRLQIDARKWIASKLKPKKYGDRTTLAGDDESPLQIAVSFVASRTG